MIRRCLLADPDEESSARIIQLLARQAVHLRTVRRAADLWARSASGGLDAMLIAEGLLGERTLEFVHAVHSGPLAPAVILLTQQENAHQRAESLAAGAFAVLNLKVGDELLAEALDTLLRRVQPLERLPPTDATAYSPTLRDFATRSPRMGRFMDLVRRVADSSSSLLLHGETGVGKEWLARAIHNASRRAGEAFVALNCAAFPDTLLYSELFGHEQGSFTGAVRSRRGHFELADGGTILLDEIGDMPLHMQANLLRVLQEREVVPLGSEDVIHVDVRVLAATNKDVADLSRRGLFRSDLLYRLGVVTLEIPPLRERREDIPELAQRHAAELGMAQRGTPFVVDPEAVRVLVGHDWPGNVRELVNVLERAVLLSTEPLISLGDLALAVKGGPPSQLEQGLDSRAIAGGGPEDLKSVRRRAADAAEHAYLSGLLRRTSGRVGETARLAGVTPRAMHSRMRHLGLRKEGFR